MLYLTLTILESIVYLVFINWMIRRTKYPSVIAFAFVACVMLFTIEWISPLIGAYFFLTWLGTVVWKRLKGSKRQYLVMTLLLLTITFAVPLWQQSNEVDKLNRWREQYPFESMADRVPPPIRMSFGPLPQETLKRLDELEEDALTIPHNTVRARALERLHRFQVERFIDMPGFGRSRIIYPSTSVYVIEQNSRNDDLIRQPERERISQDISLLSLLPTNSSDMDRLNRLSIIDFSYLAGAGYVRNRHEVAGFQSHRFSRMPSSDEWRIRRLDLIGLLLHEKPVVYVSDHLPAMSHSQKGDIRELDKFENLALELIRRGEDLVIVDESDGDRRMVGSVRSINQCVKCHDCEKGDLLGAFSYRLRRLHKQ